MFRENYKYSMFLYLWLEDSNYIEIIINWMMIWRSGFFILTILMKAHRQTQHTYTHIQHTGKEKKKGLITLKYMFLFIVVWKITTRYEMRCTSLLSLSLSLQQWENSAINHLPS